VPETYLHYSKDVRTLKALKGRFKNLLAAIQDKEIICEIIVPPGKGSSCVERKGRSWEDDHSDQSSCSALREKLRPLG
jgi:hypothetical protein